MNDGAGPEASPSQGEKALAAERAVAILIFSVATYRGGALRRCSSDFSCLRGGLSRGPSDAWLGNERGDGGPQWRKQLGGEPQHKPFEGDCPLRWLLPEYFFALMYLSPCSSQAAISANNDVEETTPRCSQADPIR